MIVFALTSLLTVLRLYAIVRLSSGKSFFRRSFWETKETTWKESPQLTQRQAAILRSRCLLSDYSQVILRSIPPKSLLLSDLAQCFLTDTQRLQLRFYTSEFPSHETSTWNIRLFPKPVGSTASRSPRDTSVRIALVCSVRNLRDIPKWDKHFHSNSHSLGRIFVSPQASSEFESKMALDWSRCARSPKYACIAG